VIDGELSRAVVAYVDGPGPAWPHLAGLDAVAAAMGNGQIINPFTEEFP
jgi:hypothetical protein